MRQCNREQLLEVVSSKAPTWLAMRPTRGRIVGLGVLFCFAGCGEGGFNKLSAPNQENVQLVRGEFSGRAASGMPKVSALEGRAVAQWATLDVSVTLEGPAPSPQQLTVSRDNSVCQPGGRPVFDPAISVGEDKSLGNVLLYLNTDLPLNDADAEEPIWVHSRYSISKHPELGEVEFDQKQCLFLSPVFAMRSSQTLKVLNSDPVGHNTKANTTKAAPLNETIPSNSFITYNPGAEERNPFRVECSIHPWMQAFMITRDNPYFGVSDVKQRGRFTIADIPAEVELEYRVWVVKDFANSDSTVLTLDGEAVEIKRGGKVKFTLAADETPHELKVVVNSSAFGN